jgi:macrolide transport system ATP-binding/permease protein
MRTIRRFFLRLMNLFSRGRGDREFSAEIEAHLALMQEEFERRGMSPEQARREALVKMGGVEQARELHREARVFSLLDQVGQDVRYALRQLFRSPGFAVTAILVLALGIGLNTAIFTLFDEVAFRPLPVKDSDRIVGIYETFHGQYSRHMVGNIHMISYDEFQQYASRNRVFTKIAAYADARDLSLGGRRPEPISGILITEDYFDVLGAGPALGRVFVSADFSPPHPVVVLSSSFWRGHFGSDPDIAGKTIQINQTVFTIVGVTPPNFSGAEVKAPDVWIPLPMQPRLMKDLNPDMPHDFLVTKDLSWLTPLAKLTPGVTVKEAQSDLQFIAQQIDASYPGRTTTVSAIPSTFLSNPDAQTVVLIGGSLVLAAVGLVLFVACANIANLLLARAAARQKEIAVRLAIGATRARLIRQLLTESTLLAFVGGALGFLLAWKSLEVPRALLQMPAIDLTPDWRVLTYGLVLSAVSSLMFGLIPAIQSTNPDLSGAMKEEGSIFGRRVRRGGARNRLIIVQVTVCTVFLIVAGLLVRRLEALNRVEPGFYVKNVSVTSLDLRMQNYDDTRSAIFYRDLMARIDAEPGATSALVLCVPWHGICGSGVRLEGRSASDPLLTAQFNQVSNSYFDVMGIRVVEGRAFSEAEVERGDSVAVVSQAMEKQFWPGQTAIGKRFSEGSPTRQSPMLEIIGVVADLRSAHIWSSDGPFFYLPVPRNVSPNVVTRFAKGQPSPGTIEKIVGQIDPNVLASVTSMPELLVRQNMPVRIGALMALTLGALVLALASVGIYGVMAYVVGQRTREIAIRMTLGAEKAAVTRFMLRETMRPVIIGMAIGVPLAAGVTIVASTLIVGVGPLDPIAFLTASAFLLAVAALASYLPARRAMRVDPMVALRHE